MNRTSLVLVEESRRIFLLMGGGMDITLVSMMLEDGTYAVAETLPTQNGSKRAVSKVYIPWDSSVDENHIKDRKSVV